VVSLLLVDGPSVWFRAFHGVPDTVRAPDGSPVNAVRGTLDHLARLVREHRPARLVVADDWDWRPAWRVALVPAYKLHRVAPDGGDAVPDLLGPQVPVVLDVLAALGVPVVGAAGYEADDVVATLATRSPDPVVVATGDRDLFQLVRDDPVRVRVAYLVEKGRLYGPADVAVRFGIPGTAYADFALLRGDASDGLPGVRGVGDKGAAALVTRFGSTAALLAALDGPDDGGFPAGTRTRLAAARAYLDAAEPVVRVVTDLSVDTLPPVAGTLPASPAEPGRLVALSSRWGLDSALERLLQAIEVARAR